MPRPTADAKAAPKPKTTAPSAEPAPKPAVAKKATPPAVEPKPSEPPRPQAHAPLTASTPAPAPAKHADATDSHDIVDFDETIPATEAMLVNRPSIAVPLVVRASAPASSQNPFISDAKPALAPLSEPPRSRESEPPAPVVAAPAPPPSSSGSGLESKRIAPVVMPPPRAALAPPPGPDAVPPSIPKAPPSSVPVVSPRPSPTPVVRPVDPVNAGQRTLLTEPPPELDGSKRRRMVRFLVAGLVIAALGLTWTVVRSQIDLSSGTSPPTTATTSVAPPPPPPPPPPPEPQPTATTTGAIEPGKVSHPTKSQNTATPKPIVKPRPRKQPADGEVVVPDPGDDSISPAP